MGLFDDYVGIRQSFPSPLFQYGTQNILGPVAFFCILAFSDLNAVYFYRKFIFVL